MRQTECQVLGRIALSVAQAPAGKIYHKQALAQISELKTNLLRNEDPVVAPIKRLKAGLPLACLDYGSSGCTGCTG